MRKHHVETDFRRNLGGMDELARSQKTVIHKMLLELECYF
jgi:hypothetical protein